MYNPVPNPSLNTNPKIAFGQKLGLINGQVPISLFPHGTLSNSGLRKFGHGMSTVAKCDKQTIVVGMSLTLWRYVDFYWVQISSKYMCSVFNAIFKDTIFKLIFYLQESCNSFLYITAKCGLLGGIVCIGRDTERWRSWTPKRWWLWLNYTSWSSHLLTVPSNASLLPSHDDRHISTPGLNWSALLRNAIGVHLVLKFRL